MVWVQIALAPVVIVMMNVSDNNGTFWRWNLVNWLMVGGYILGLLALPVSRGLEKPKLLTWWLRIDFWFSLIPSVFILPLLLKVGWHQIDAEDGDFVLYRHTGLMAVAPYFHLGEKDGIFIRELPHGIRLYDYGDVKIDCFRVDTLNGYTFGLNRGAPPATWVCPIDSVKYHQNAKAITALIDSLYQVQPLLSHKSFGRFVFPDNFAEISYHGGTISYEDSIRYDIDFLERDSLRVTIFDSKFTHLPYPKNTVGNLSPKEVRTFIERLKGSKR